MKDDEEIADGRAQSEAQDETDAGSGETPKGAYGQTRPRKATYLPPPGAEFKSAREAHFVDALLSDPERNQTRAAIIAGYGNGNYHAAGSRASELMQKPRIQAAIARREAAGNVMLPELIGIRVECARNAHLGNVLEVYDDGTFDVDLKKAVETGAIEWIKEISFDRYGRPKIKMVDRFQALEQLDHIFGMKGEQRPQEGLEALRAAKIHAVLDTLKATNESKYQEFVLRLQANPETRKYVAQLES